MCLEKILYTRVFGSLVHNSQKVEATQLSIDGLMGKHNMPHPY